MHSLSVLLDLFFYLMKLLSPVLILLIPALIILIPVLILYLLVSVPFFIVTFLNFKKLNVLLSFIGLYVITIITVIIVTIVLYEPILTIINSNSSDTDGFKNLISPVVTTIGLIVTTIIAFSNSSSNQEKQSTDLIISMIKQQKELQTDDFEKVVEKISDNCNLHLKRDNIAFIRLMKIINIQLDQLKSNNFYYVEDDPTILNELKKLKKENNIERQIELILLYGLKESSFRQKRAMFKNISPSNKLKTSSISSNNFKYKEISDYFTDPNFWDKLIVNQKEIDNIYSDIKYDEAFEIINDIYRLEYYKLGHYFKHFHRIVKLINSKTKFNKNLKNELTGILRSQLPERVLTLIFYNATYTSRGHGLGYIMQGLCFWGDKDDFVNEGNKEITHISSTSLIFKHDKNIMINVYGDQKHLKRKISKEEFEEKIRSNFN